jgi:hypothetical protein
MKAGSYGAQNINVTKTTPGCTVIAETTTTLTGTLTTSGAWYEIQNITGTGWNVSSAGTNNVICRECNFDGAQVDWTAANYSNISWIGGSLKNFSTAVDDHGMAIWNAATDVLVDGVTFDNIVNTGTTANHFEVIRVDGNVNGLTIRKSTFTNNNASTATIFFSTFRGDKPQNILIENNFFEPPGDAFGIFDANFQGTACSNWTFNYNTFRASQFNDVEAQCGNSLTNLVWVGNIAPRGNCSMGTSFRTNLWYGSSGAACGGTDSVSTTAAVNFDTDGLHITAGSSAIDAGGSGADCIATDHDGNSRSDPCDAGAHEFGATGGSQTFNISYYRLMGIIGAGLLLGALGGLNAYRNRGGGGGAVVARRPASWTPSNGMAECKNAALAER